MIVLADIGEWIPAYVGLGLVFLVATVGAAGLGVWVMRGDARNRAAQRSRQSATGGSGATAESERRSDDQSGSLTEEKAP